MSAQEHQANKNIAEFRKGIPTANVATFMLADSETIAARHTKHRAADLDLAVCDFNIAKDNIMRASDELHEKMNSLSKNAKESVSRAKDASAQMADAMGRITKVLGPDFEKRLAQLETLTNCMERLSVLNESGKLTKVIGAISA